MGIASSQPHRIYHPQEEGEWIEVRQLGGAALDHAAKEGTHRIFETARAMGADLFIALREQREEIAAADTDPNRDPLSGYDALALLDAGVLAWSYSERVTKTAIRDLDPVTRDWAAREILKLSLPPGEDEVKNSA